MLLLILALVLVLAVGLGVYEATSHGAPRTRDRETPHGVDQDSTAENGSSPPPHGDGFPPEEEPDTDCPLCGAPTLTGHCDRLSLLCPFRDDFWKD